MTTRIGLAVALLASASASRVAAAPDPVSDEITVRSLDEEVRVAALKRDIPSLERLWSDQMVVNAPNNQVVVGKRAVIDDFVRAGVINFALFERKIEFLRIDGDFATTMGLETVQPNSDAPTSGLRAASACSAASRTSGGGREAPGVCSFVTPT